MKRSHNPIFFLLPLLFFVGACATIQSQWQQSASRRILDDTSRHAPEIRLLYKSLEAAYANKSLTRLDEFFEAWRQDPNLQPLTNPAALSDTIKAVYDVFRAFSDSLCRPTMPFVVLPTSMAFLVDDSVGPETYRNPSPFAASHGSVVTDVPLLARRKLPAHVIHNFRPSYQSGKSRILYLDDTYNRALHLFLEPPETESAESSQSFAIESKERANFLRNRIPVLKGHNGYYFFFELPPIVDRVCLSKDLNYAEVSHSRGDFSGSTDALIRRDGRWGMFHPFYDVWVQ